LGGSAEQDVELSDNSLLPDKLVQAGGSERTLKLAFGVVSGHRGKHSVVVHD
jgi:hypothetical protein